MGIKPSPSPSAFSALGQTHTCSTLHPAFHLLQSNQTQKLLNPVVRRVLLWPGGPEFLSLSPEAVWPWASWFPSLGFSLSVLYQFSSVTQSCPTLCNPMNRSMPGLPVYHQLPEFTQTHIHRIGDAIQPSHPLSSPSSPAPNPS